jgi:3-methyladenine DNA glycosylase Mpg
LQEWVPAKAVTRFLSFLKGPSKAAQAFGLTPNRYSVRLNDFLQLSLGEGKKEDDADQKWSDAGLLLFVSCP